MKMLQSNSESKQFLLMPEIIHTFISRGHGRLTLEEHV